jgi:hypothetical protein
MNDYGCNLLCVCVSEHVWGPPMGNESDPYFGIDQPWENCSSGGGFQLREFNPVFWNKLDRLLLIRMNISWSPARWMPWTVGWKKLHLAPGNHRMQSGTIIQPDVR